LFLRNPTHRRGQGRARRNYSSEASIVTGAQLENPAKESGVSIIGWLILGLIAGFIASKLVNKEGSGLVLDIVLGIIGALVGGFLFTQLGGIGITGFNLYSMLVAIIGAVIVLAIYHVLFGRRTTV
jgi:uncharacterized membrane protein YeaQ/YmgE (transglycosylase-associated protein family)